MAKLLSLLILVAMFVLLIPTGLVLASQNAVPGDTAYPIKRKMEDVIVNIASLHPTTKAYFRVDLTNRRLDESIKLVGRQDSVLADKTLYEYAAQTNEAVKEIMQIQDQKTRREVAKKMLAELDAQKKKLDQLKVEQSKTGLSPTNATPSPSGPTPTPVLVQVPQRQGTQVVIIVVTATPTLIPPTPTPTPRPSTPQQPQSPPSAPAGGGQAAADSANTGARDVLDEFANQQDEDDTDNSLELDDSDNQASRLSTPTPVPVPAGPTLNAAAGSLIGTLLGGTPFYPAGARSAQAKVCTPGEWIPGHCGTCNANGDGFNDCTDFGSGNDGATWCGCAKACGHPSFATNTTCQSLAGNTPTIPVSQPATPTPAPATPTPVAPGPDCPGFSSEYVQCLGFKMSNGNNASCYSKADNSAQRDVCYSGCGTCP